MALYRECYFTSGDGLRLFYRDYATDSSRIPVLCLPGLTRNARDFDFIAAHIARSRRVLCADLRGRGKSAYDPDWRNYNIPMEVADSARLLDAAGVERAIVLGTSRGGIVGMSMASLPGLVAALILNDIGAEIEANGLKRLLASVGHEPIQAGWNEAASFLKEKYGAMFPGLAQEGWLRFAHALNREQDGQIVPDYDPALAQSMRAGPGQGQPLGNVNLWPLFEQIISRPVLLLHGARSDLLSQTIVAEMREAKPDLAVATLENRGHVPFLDEPDAVAAIDRFLEDL